MEKEKLTRGKKNDEKTKERTKKKTRKKKEALISSWQCPHKPREKGSDWFN